MLVRHLLDVPTYHGDQARSINLKPVFLTDKLAVLILFKVSSILPKLGSQLMLSGGEFAKFLPAYIQLLRRKLQVKNVAKCTIEGLENEVWNQRSIIFTL